MTLFWLRRRDDGAALRTFMRVLLVGPYPRQGQPVSGGVMAVVHALAQGLSQQPGVEVGVAAAAVGALQERECDGNITVFRTPVPRYPRARWYRPLRRTLADLAAAFQADVVHGHGTGFNAAAALDTLRPALVTVHGVVRQEAVLSGARRLKERWVWKFDALFEDRVLRRTHHAVAISPYVRRAFAGYGQITWYDIPNPVDEACFHVVRKPQRGRFLIPARVIPRKGIDIGIAALGQLPQGELVVAGEIDTHPRFVEDCRQLASAMGVAGRVRFAGNLSRTELLAELALAQAVVLPARQETAPVAVAEAMAAGCPVIATTVGGLPDMVASGQTGLLVSPDEPAALAGALARLLAEPGTAAAWGQTGRDQAQRYRLDVVVTQTLTVYDMLATNRK